jgi:hypothetical protein
MAYTTSEGIDDKAEETPAPLVRHVTTIESRAAAVATNLGHRNIEGLSSFMQQLPHASLHVSEPPRRGARPAPHLYAMCTGGGGVLTAVVTIDYEAKPGHVPW